MPLDLVGCGFRTWKCVMVEAARRLRTPSFERRNTARLTSYEKRVLPGVHALVM